jgi:isoamylase
MRYPRTFAAVLLCASLAAGTMKAAHALINSNNLGASYDSQNTNITFRVYSSQATRIVLYLYSRRARVRDVCSKPGQQ